MPNRLLLVVPGALLAALPLSVAPPSARAPRPACGTAARVVVGRARPRQGRPFRVRVAGVAADATLGGSVAGEPLHFADAGAGVRGALAAAPIDGASPLAVVVRCGIVPVDSIVAS